MTTRIADDYSSIKAQMARFERDRNVLQFTPPDGVIIALERPTRWKAEDGLCYVLQVATGHLTLILTRETSPNVNALEHFFNHLRQYFPSARSRSTLEISLSQDDANLLASRLWR
jgi:hypothetical protein